MLHCLLSCCDSAVVKAPVKTDIWVNASLPDFTACQACIQGCFRDLDSAGTQMQLRAPSLTSATSLFFFQSSKYFPFPYSIPLTKVSPRVFFYSVLRETSQFSVMFHCLCCSNDIFTVHVSLVRFSLDQFKLLCTQTFLTFLSFSFLLSSVERKGKWGHIAEHHLC